MEGYTDFQVEKMHIAVHIRTHFQGIESGAKKKKLHCVSLLDVAAN